jgi:hypothetical protein
LAESGATEPALSKSDLMALVKRLTARKRSGVVLRTDEQQVITLARSATKGDIAEAARIGHGLAAHRFPDAPPRIDLGEDGGSKGTVDDPLEQAEAWVDGLWTAACTDLDNEDAQKRYSVAKDRLDALKAKKRGAEGAPGGDTGAKRQRTGDEPLTVINGARDDLHDTAYDAMVTKYRSTQLQEAIDAKRIVDGSVIPDPDIFDKALLPRTAAKKVAIEGKWDISFSAQLGGSGVADHDISIDEWEHVATMWRNTVAMRRPYLRAPIDGYIRAIKGLAHRYRRERPQGFALYDIAFRRNADATFSVLGTYPQMAQGANTTLFLEVFNGARPSLCARCGACDHYAQNCSGRRGGGKGGGASGGSHNGGNRGGGGGRGDRGANIQSSGGGGPAAATGDAPDAPDTASKPGKCFDFNKPKGCTRTTCRFAHACTKCGGDHPRHDCSQ